MWFKGAWCINFSPPSQRPCTLSFRLCWTPTLSPARTRTKTRRRMELRVKRVSRRDVGKGRWMMCPPYPRKSRAWWKFTAVPWCCRGRRVCLPPLPPKPLATSSSSPTPPCSTRCWREVRCQRSYTNRSCHKCGRRVSQSINSKSV